jgi:tetratricopeptide (TPR) repeat protein
MYAEFLALAVRQCAEPESERLLDGLTAVPIDQWPGWLDQHPQATAPGMLTLLDRIAERTAAAGLTGPATSTRLMREMLGAVAAGTPPADAVSAYRAAWAKYLLRVQPEDLGALRVAADDPDPERAMLALRALLARLPEADPIGQRRAAAVKLAAHLLNSYGRPEAIEEAIALLEGVRKASPSRDRVWAEATANLGAAFGRRSGGDLVNNWRRSVALIREAQAAADLDARTLAIFETNLGLALTDRPGGATTEDLSEALEWLLRGLNRRSPDTNVEDWAYSKINLGHAYQRRRAPGDLEQAIAHYRDAIDQLRSTALTRQLVHAELNLAIALLTAHPTESVAAVNLAAAAADRAEQLDDSAVLGWAREVLGNGHAAVNGPNSLPAVDAWQRAVDVLDTRAHAAQLLRIGGRLADAYAATRAWEPLAALYQRMLAAFDALYTAQATSESQRQVLAEYPRLARWAAYALARTGRTEAAIETLERARTRELDVNARRDTADLDAVERLRPDLADRYRTALAAYRSALTHQQLVTQSAGTATSDLKAVTAATTLDSVITEIAAVPDLKSYLTAPTAAESLLAAGACQAIYITSAPAGTFVLRVLVRRPAGTLQYDAVHLDVTSRDVAHLLYVDTDTDTSAPGLVLAQTVTDSVYFQRALAQLERRFASVVATVASLAAETAPEPAVLVPTGLSGLIPLQSVPISDDGATLDDVAEVHLTPSLAVYTASRRRAARPIPPVLVGIADPDGSLPGSRGELAAIAARPGWASMEVAVGAEATLDWLAAHAPDASHLHLACHGNNDLTDPDGGHLSLAGDDLLTVAALAHNISLRARVATASACQSGHFDTLMIPDEYIGLAGGLLQAGAACAVVSLWPVDDEATSLLMTRFYELLDANSVGQPQTQKPQTALRDARLWLRGLSETDRATYLDQHPVLASELRARRLPTRTVRNGSRGPYDTVEHWGAFVAYGY